MLTVSCDRSADLKLLRRLEREGKITVVGVAIEGHEQNRKLKTKTLPAAVWDSPLSTWDNSKWASEASPLKEIEAIIGKQHHGDVLHFEDHVTSGRDIFVTDDNDFLSRRVELEERFATKICSAKELAELLDRGR